VIGGVGWGVVHGNGLWGCIECEGFVDWLRAGRCVAWSWLVAWLVRWLGG